MLDSHTVSYETLVLSSRICESVPGHRVCDSNSLKDDLMQSFRGTSAVCRGYYTQTQIQRSLF